MSPRNLGIVTVYTYFSNISWYFWSGLIWSDLIWSSSISFTFSYLPMKPDSDLYHPLKLSVIWLPLLQVYCYAPIWFHCCFPFPFRFCFWFFCRWAVGTVHQLAASRLYRWTYTYYGDPSAYHLSSYPYMILVQYDITLCYIILHDIMSYNIIWYNII